MSRPDQRFERRGGVPLDWQQRPIVGASDRLYRARQWRRVLLALGLFWAVVIWALLR